jgi:predicted anti-sigma-YlaC factor YlaD
MVTYPEMPCQELVELITDYLEGALSHVDRERFEEHLKNCRHCRTYLEQMRQTIRALGRLPETSIPEKAKADLLEAFRDWHKGQGA